MRILFLSQWYPYPPNNGSKLRIYNLLRGLASKHEVSLICFSDRYRQGDELLPTILDSLCSDIQVVQSKRFDPKSRQALLGFFNPVPRSLRYTYSSEMEQAITRSLESHKYDLVIVSQWTMTAYSRCFMGYKLLLEELELGWIRNYDNHTASPWTRFRNRLTWIKLRNYLANLMKVYQACTVVSDEERLLIEDIVSSHESIHVIPNCVDLAEYQDIDVETEAMTIIFTGSFLYHPNYEAMVWFTEKVLPLIRAELPDVKVKVTGNNGGLDLPDQENITLTGFVDDIRPHIAGSWLSIVPLWTGGGTRLKILESMALKTPVVATSKGAEGLGVQSDRDILIADTPQDFARNVIRLLREPDTRKKLSINGYKLVSEKYSWSIVMPKFLHIIDEVIDCPNSHL
jgi:glycosyltransferase involved in cell wall biosynthesis